MGGWARVGGHGGTARGARRQRRHAAWANRSREALFKVARGASVARRINIVPEKVTQVDDMLIPRSSCALLHKLLSAPEDRGSLPFEQREVIEFLVA